MTIRAYSDLYIDLAQRVCGDMLDFAVNEVGMKADEYMALFLISGVSRQIERGNVKYIAGMNGCEIVRQVLQETGADTEIPEDIMYADKSPEYWAGWVLAFYQWYRNITFSDILDILPINELIKMYPVYHEADIMRFTAFMDDKIRTGETRLKKFRLLRNISQKELADKAGISVRQIQLFEQRQRDINKTQGTTLLQISRALGCRMEDLIEPVTASCL